MKDLNLNIKEISNCFRREPYQSYEVIYVSEKHALSWPGMLGIGFRQCYIDDNKLNEHFERTGKDMSQLVASKLPDPGSTMAGDFGEIITFLYHAAVNIDEDIIGPKKWRLKQDRTKPSPYSDVVHFILPVWPHPSDRDYILCTEVKTKSTGSEVNDLINKAIEDCNKDKKSRLTKTLLWLKERALTEDLGSVTLEHLDRFINAIDFPPAKIFFYASVVVCSTLTEKLLEKATVINPPECNLILIIIPNLKKLYEDVYSAAHGAVKERGGS